MVTKHKNRNLVIRVGGSSHESTNKPRRHDGGDAEPTKIEARGRVRVPPWFCKADTVIRAITVKYVARLRRTTDIEVRSASSAPRRKLYLETKDRQDVSHYSPQRVQVQASAGDETARD